MASITRDQNPSLFDLWKQDYLDNGGDPKNVTDNSINNLPPTVTVYFQQGQQPPHEGWGPFLAETGLLGGAAVGVPALIGALGAGGAGAAGAAAGAAGTGASTASKIMNLIGAGGTALAGATGQAGVNQLEQEKLALEANQQNITGQNAYENELINIAKENAAAQEAARKNAFRLSVAQNPRTSPYDVAGPVQLSPDYLASLKANATPGAPIANPTPYAPIPPGNVQGATNTRPSTLQTIGQILSPALTIGSKVAPFFQSQPSTPPPTPDEFQAQA